MTDLILLVPELVLVGMALVLIVIARRVQRAWAAASFVVIAAVAAICSSLVFSSVNQDSIEISAESTTFVGRYPNR